MRYRVMPSRARLACPMGFASPSPQEGGRRVTPDDFRSPPWDKEEEHPFLLPWHAAGTLDAWTSRRIEEHLSGCASCRAELEALTSMSAMLRRHEGTGHLDVCA